MTLANDFIRDQIADIRFSRRKIAAGINVEEEEAYIKDCIKLIRAALPHRHNLLLDQYGWPVCCGNDSSINPD